MNAPVIYNVHPATGEYIGTGYADPDPILRNSRTGDAKEEGLADDAGWLMPAHAYCEAPPETGDNEKAIRSGSGWTITPDYRGTVWDTVTKESRTHKELGALPEGLTHLEPGDFDTWSGTEWLYDVTAEVANTLPEVVAALNQACKAAIGAGFSSSALGAVHYYDSDLEDQLNLSGNIQRGKDVPHKCKDEAGVTDYRIHTAAQILEVGEDFANHKIAQLMKCATLKQQAATAAAEAVDASDLAALKAIAWS